MLLKILHIHITWVIFQQFILRDMKPVVFIVRIQSPSSKSAKLRALRAKNVPACQRVFCAYVLTCQRDLCAYVLTCQRALRAYPANISTSVQRCFWVDMTSRRRTTSNQRWNNVVYINVEIYNVEQCWNNIVCFNVELNNVRQRRNDIANMTIWKKI